MLCVKKQKANLTFFFVLANEILKFSEIKTEKSPLITTISVFGRNKKARREKEFMPRLLKKKSLLRGQQAFKITIKKVSVPQSL